MFMKDHDWGFKMESAERPITLEQSWMQHWLIHFNSFFNRECARINVSRFLNMLLYLIQCLDKIFALDRI